MKSSMISAANIDKIKKIATKIEKKVTFEHFFKIFWALVESKTSYLLSFFNSGDGGGCCATP